MDLPVHHPTHAPDANTPKQAMRLTNMGQRFVHVAENLALYPPESTTVRVKVFFRSCFGMFLSRYNCIVLFYEKRYTYALVLWN